MHALLWSSRHAPTRASTIRLVRAWDLTVVGGLELATAAARDMEPECAYEFEDRFSEEMKALDVSVESSVEYGIAASVLLRASEYSDLLVVGSRGLGGFKRLLLGSTSHQCATHARVPVAVVPRSASVDAEATDIVVGIDGSAGSRSALAWAIGFAGPRTTVTAVGTWHPFAASASDETVRNLDMSRAREEFSAVVDDVENAAGGERVARREFRRGHPALVLLEAAETADMIVVGERGHRGLRAALLGSTATEVLHRAACTTVIVPVDDLTVDGEETG